MHKAKSSAQKLGVFRADVISSVLCQGSCPCADIGVLLVTGETGVGWRREPGGSYYSQKVARLTVAHSTTGLAT